MFYRLLGELVCISFNVLNLILGGNLPPLGSTCVVVEEEGRYLVVNRRGGSLVFPGGFVRWRENPAQAALREAVEETGLQLKILGIVGCYSTTGRTFRRLSTITVVYRAEVIGGTLRASVEGQPVWCDEETVRNKLVPMQHPILRDVLELRAQWKHN